ncbi:hypothetical protein [Beggiatoa leptomitoformis]|uniref:Uncharacterized protein n=1 Tax=Beggiatoa leptomitoformis TaxID=288004 RepID=A0A2N9YFV0_9GAMM|nr:hypothetical protein [Beggiatoa leptomitoformis]ALG68422.1 hypothetical protein AL038_12815 [Beggiatoa leptomitoformis]AUI69249.1 hypothetical protein BLE401_11455 [Beggiatoa leptomitoformis]
MHTNFLIFYNDDGRRFSVKILRKSENYGDDDALTYYEDEPSLEFFDATGFEAFSDEPILGYFTGIRCLISELFIDAQNRPTQLTESFAVWNISEANLTTVHHWLLKHLTEQERNFVPYAEREATDIVPPAIKLSSFDRVMDEISPDASVCVPSIPSPMIGNKTNSNNMIQQQLATALHALDIAETTETSWNTGTIQARLHIMAAKKHILQTIALLITKK